MSPESSLMGFVCLFLQAASHGYHRAYSPSPPEGSNKKRDRHNGDGKEQTDSTVAETEERYCKDWRNFQCKTWHLEPTVR